MNNRERERSIKNRLGAFAAGILALYGGEVKAFYVDGPPVQKIPYGTTDTGDDTGVGAVSATFSTETPHEQVESMTWKEKIEYLSQVEFDYPYLVMNFVDPDTGQLRINWKALLEPLTLKFGYETAMRILDIDINYEYAPNFVRTNPQSPEAYEYIGEQIQKSFREVLISEIMGLSFFKDEIKRYPFRDRVLGSHNRQKVESITIIGEASSAGDTPESVLSQKESQNNLALARARGERAKTSLLEVLPYTAFYNFKVEDIITNTKVYELAPEEIKELYAMASEYGFHAKSAESIFQLYKMYNNGEIESPSHVEAFKRIVDSHRGAKISVNFKKGQSGAVVLGMPMWLVFLWLAHGTYRRFRPIPAQRETQRRSDQAEIDQIQPVQVGSPSSPPPRLRLIIGGRGNDKVK